MQTRFSQDQRADPRIGEADRILRSCVHCGFCLSACPTYAVTGDELDSPRGRIYLIKEMLEKGGPASATAVHHIDRCLSCLGCLTSCPSGVDYMHLVDGARAHIEAHHRRPVGQRLSRWFLATVLSHPALLRLALAAAAPARLLGSLVPKPLRHIVAAAPARRSRGRRMSGGFPAEGPVRRRVALLAGCVQSVLGAHINDAAIRLLTRHGCEVVVPAGAGCCGALAHHLGRGAQARAQASANLAAWTAEANATGLDAIVVSTSGCGTMIKDYGHMFARDPRWAGTATRFASLARDITEVLGEVGLGPTVERGPLTVAYHDACSLQHGQRITGQPRALLAQAGFRVAEIGEGHFCCGSAGTYSLLQPEMADALGARKAVHVEAAGAAAVASGNLGCMVQIGRFTGVPMVHTAELLDWATGGPVPVALHGVPALAKG